MTSFATLAKSGGGMDGRVVLLTGASSEVGALFAAALSDLGARVALVARRVDRLENLAARLPGAVPVPVDLSDPDAVPSIVERVRSKLGRIDVLVNLAGTAHNVDRSGERLDDVVRTVSVNLTTPLMLCEAVLDDMRAGSSSSIVNVASISGVVGIPRIPQPSYAASKGGLVALTRQLAAEWGRYGIRVNALVPGFFPSDMTAAIYSNEKLRDWIESNVMLPRTPSAADMVGPLLFLASDMSAYVTGQCLVVDGGWTCH